MERRLRKRADRAAVPSGQAGISPIPNSNFLIPTALDGLHGSVYDPAMAAKRPSYGWNARRVRALRDHLAVTQEELAAELNVRQQTVSEWETGQYRPRGASERLLTLVAERAEFSYGEPGEQEEARD